MLTDWMVEARLNVSEEDSGPMTGVEGEEGSVWR